MKTVFIILTITIGLTLTMFSPIQVEAQFSGSAPVPLTSSPNWDRAPSILQALNGTVWLAWDSDYIVKFPNGTVRDIIDIYYRTYNQNNGWGPTINLTASYEADVSPSLAQFQNGTMVLAWASSRAPKYDYEIYMRRYDGTKWLPEERVTFDTRNDLHPAIAVGKDNSLWLFWNKDLGGNEEIFYKRRNASGWSAELALTSNSADDRVTKATVTKDGKVWVVWSRVSGSADQDIWFATIDQGLPTPEVHLSSDARLESWPAIFQDRDGIIWVFWNREYSYGRNLYQDELVYTYSKDNGKNFVPDIRLTSDAAGFEKDDREVTGAQIIDKTIWLVYTSNPEDASTGDESWDLQLIKSSPILIHDALVRSIDPQLTFLRKGQTEGVTVAVSNRGDFTEDLEVTLFAKNSSAALSLGTRKVTLISGGTGWTGFEWNTAVALPGRYSLVAVITPLMGESIANQIDNSLQQGEVRVLYAEDVDLNGKVNLDDLILVYTKQGSKDPAFDVNYDGIVNLDDLLLVFVAQGKAVP